MLPKNGRPKREAALKAESFMEEFLVQEYDQHFEHAQDDDLNDYLPETGLLDCYFQLIDTSVYRYPNSGSRSFKKKFLR